MGGWVNTEHYICAWKVFLGGNGLFGAERAGRVYSGQVHLLCYCDRLIPLITFRFYSPIFWVAFVAVCMAVVKDSMVVSRFNLHSRGIVGGESFSFLHGTGWVGIPIWGAGRT